MFHPAGWLSICTWLDAYMGLAGNLGWQSTLGRLFTCRYGSASSAGTACTAPANQLMQIKSKIFFTISNLHRSWSFLNNTRKVGFQAWAKCSKTVRENLGHVKQPQAGEYLKEMSKEDFFFFFFFFIF